LLSNEGENRVGKTIGVYLWQNMTMLDVLGSHQFLGFVPGFKVVTFAKTKDPVVTDTNVCLIPDHDFTTCPPLDILLVGGGANPLPEMQDENVMSFLRQVGDSAEYITSVCTGSLILAHAGLLDGYQATTHWAYKDRLDLYPRIKVVTGRVVTDRNRITGGGVTAGMDFALPLIERLAGLEAAAGLQLLTEYDPQPPTNCGSPDTAPPQLTAAMRQQLDDMTPGLTEFITAKTGPAA
jgi:transcriptional regulator GlxA family with amidase domain